MKNCVSSILLLGLGILSSISLSAQVEGLWVVKQVEVGAESVTPVAKWFHLHPDQKVTGGNGGVHNISGTWAYEDAPQRLLFTDSFGVPDEYGAFQVEQAGSEMKWSREEEGQSITVSLEKADAMPQGPWDKLVGQWRVGMEETVQQYSFRWDRIFIHQGDKRTRGIWHIDGHRPILTLLPQDEKSTQWTIEFKGESAIFLQGLNEVKDQTIHLIRQ